MIRELVVIILSSDLPLVLSLLFFFFQAEDGIRDDLVTGVQTCALPIFHVTRSGDVDPAVGAYLNRVAGLDFAAVDDQLQRHAGLLGLAGVNDMRTILERSEERRVGKECRSRWSPYH